MVEKILEEIEKEFDRRIDTQLKIMAGLNDDVYRYGYGKSLEAYQQGKILVEDIIRKRMNDGWIPVDERLPDEKEFLKSYRRNRYAAEFIVMIEGATLPTTLYFRDGVWADEENNHYRDIAWKPLPEPYRPDGRIYETDPKISGE